MAALGGPIWIGDTDSIHIGLQSPRTLRQHLMMARFIRICIRADRKPLVRLGEQRLLAGVETPYPPLIGNGVLANAWA